MMDKNLNPFDGKDHLTQPIGSMAVLAGTAKPPHFVRLRTFLTDPGRGRTVTAVAVLTVLIGTATFLAYGTSLHLGKVQTAQQTLHTGSSDDALQQIIARQVADYRFTLTAPDMKDQKFNLGDAGITVNDAKTVTNVRQEVRHLSWQRFAWWHKTEVPLVIARNQAQFDAFVNQHIATANQPAVDASIAVVSGKADTTEAKRGWTYQLPGGNYRLAQTARTLQPLNVSLERVAVLPKLSAKDLTTAAAKINGYTAHDVSFTVGDHTITPTANDIGSWLDIDPVPDRKTADVTVNSGKLQAYLDKATKVDIQVPRSQISTTDSNGVVTVLVPGQDGTTIADKTAVVKDVVTQLQTSGKTVHADLAVTHQAFSSVNAADYDKWIVADVSTKRMYAYEHNTLVRSFLISAGAPKTPTVIGTYKIYSKIPIKTMRGANADGSRYEQPDVKYVNYFYRDYAIHGNYWRPKSYFGNINSSHGCLGITDSDAEWIYNWAPIGTTVITHA